MTIAPGSRLGVYEITAHLGEGGMGQVFRATDTKLKRQVAIKILPASFAADHHRRARFQREAEVLASLNHPHIAGIHGVEESQGVSALVMELVEGEDLAQRIARGAIPIEEAMAIARQIAEALEAAHERGIIHRDLKPANIKLRPDGTVKVLDFGLAKALDQRGSDPGLVGPSLSTITSPALTEAGVILGTAAYMAPEQARGKAVDRRADIWAFGAVLFEMLTGERAFPGEDVAETMANVINTAPDWSLLPALLSPTQRTCLRRCLQKNPRQRIADAQDLRLALEGAFELDVTPTPPGTPATNSVRRSAWIAMGVLATLAFAFAIPAVRHFREVAPGALPETRLDLVTPGTASLEDFALSPDGRQLAFVVAGETGSRLWVRTMSSTTAQSITGTDGASAPFWSPDGRAIAFFANSSLKRIDLNGGTPQTLASISADPRGGTWNADGTILFADAGGGPILRISANGGDATAVTKPEGRSRHGWPIFLPDGHRFLYLATGGPDIEGIYLGSLDRATVARRLTARAADLTESAGVYLPDTATAGAASPERGHLLWVRSGSLVAQRLDIDNGVLTGEPLTLANPVAMWPPSGKGAISASQSGVLAYRASANRPRQLRWFDRSGKDLGALGEPDLTLSTPSVSSDGRRAAVYRNVQGNGDIWVLDGSRTSRFTSDPAIEGFPLWSTDGSRIVFRSRRTGTWELYQKFSGGTGPEELLLQTSGDNKIALSWSRGGQFLMYQENDAKTGPDLFLLPLDGHRASGKPLVFLQTQFAERAGRFSPDGRWVAYVSNETRRWEVYVRPFHEPSSGAAPAAGEADAVWPVSNAGGIQPRWGPGGKEVFYLNPAGEMMSVSVTVKGTSLELGPPVRLFVPPIFGGGMETGSGTAYDVTSDGRFLIITELDNSVPPITLVQHWDPNARR